MSKFLIVVSALYLFAVTVVMVVGIASPYWNSRPGFHMGLWEFCRDGLLKDQPTTCMKLDNRPDFKDWYNGVRALVLLAVASSAVSLLLLVLYLCKYDGQRSLMLMRVVVSLILLAVLLCIIGVILYSVNRTKINGYKLGWSFSLTTAFGSALTLLLFPLTIEIRRSRRLGAYESI